MTPPTTNEPQTEAGRALLEGHADAAVYCGSNDAVMSAAILAIEAEATRTALEGLAERVRAARAHATAGEQRAKTDKEWDLATRFSAQVGAYDNVLGAIDIALLSGPDAVGGKP